MALMGHAVIPPHYGNKDWRRPVYFNCRRSLCRSPEQTHKHTQRSAQEIPKDIFPLVVWFGFISWGFEISSWSLLFFFLAIQRQSLKFSSNLNSKFWFQELWPRCKQSVLSIVWLELPKIGKEICCFPVAPKPVCVEWSVLQRSDGDEMHTCLPTRGRSPLPMASGTRTTTGATVMDTTGASTPKGAADSDLQVWTPFVLPVFVSVSRGALSNRFGSRRWIPAHRTAPAARHPRRMLRLWGRFLRPQDPGGHSLRGRIPEERRSEREQGSLASFWRGSWGCGRSLRCTDTPTDTPIGNKV